MTKFENIFALTNKMEEKDFVCFHEKTEHYILVLFQSPVFFSYDAIDYFPVNKNSLVLYTPGQVQAYKANGDYFVNSFLIFDTDDGQFDNFGFPVNKPFSLPQETINEIVILLDGVSFIRNTDYFPEKRGQLPEILHGLFEKIERSYSEGEDSTVALLYSLREDILNDPKSNSVSILAQKAGYSEPYFCKLYRKQFGITPGRERQRQTIRAIKSYLETTDYSLEAIAELCGLSSLPFMIKIFKRAEGMTPHQYRLKIFKHPSEK